MQKILSIEQLMQTPVCMMTGEQLAFLMSNLSLLADKSDNNTEKVENTPKNVAYGIKGIADIFGCSIPTANRIKRSGIIDEAISQNNRTILLDVDKVLQLVAESKKNGKGSIAKT